MEGVVNGVRSTPQRQRRLANAGHRSGSLEGIVCPHRESQRLTDQTRENTDSENIHDKTVSTRLLPGKWERLPQALHTTQERCSQPEAVATRLEAVPFHVNACHVIVEVRVCNPTDRSAEIQIELQTELSRLLFVTIEDVAHKEDLRRIRPLKAVVCFHGAVNWSSHHGTDREHAPAAHRTRCISVELKRPAFHTNTNLAGAKREPLLDKGQRNINADCRGYDLHNPTKTARSPSTVTARLATNTKPTLRQTTAVPCLQLRTFLIKVSVDGFGSYQVV